MTIRWTRMAAEDLSKISDHTEERFGAAQAKRAANTIYEAADLLKSQPNRGRIGRRPGTREIVVIGLPFVIIYRVEGDVAQILRILHGAQQWQ